jgi:drug/metabolite transporter (DMT)-like permease
VLAALGATLLWGINYTVAKRVVAEIDPLAIASARAAAGMLVFGSLMLWRDGIAGFTGSRLARALPLGLLGIFANQILFIEGLKRSTASHSAILIALLPVNVLILSALTGQERLGWMKGLGVLIAFSGVVLVAAEKGIDLRSEYLRGDLLTLCSGWAFAAFTVAGRPVLRDLGALRTTTCAFLGGGTAILLVGSPAALRQDWQAASRPALYGLLYLMAGATVGAYLLYYFAIARLEPSKVAAFMYLQPLVAAAIAYLLGGEALTRYLVGGAALILTGVMLAERSR